MWSDRARSGVAVRAHLGRSYDLMAGRGGMTHGGFYTHVSDRDELVAAAVAAAAAETAEQVFGEDRTLEEVLDTVAAQRHTAHDVRTRVLVAVRPGGLAKLMGYSLAMLPRWVRVRLLGAIMAGMTEQGGPRGTSTPDAR